MASRKDEKEALRRERLEREEAAKAAERRRQLVGYGVGGALALAALVVIVVLAVSSGGGGDDGNGGGDLYPGGASIPQPGPLSADVERAAEAAGCELKSNKAPSREHTGQGVEVRYAQNPPTGGKHFAEWSEDGVYDDQPREEELVHTLEHGRVIFWFKRDLPAADRGKLKALFDEDNFHLVLTPNETKMPYAVAATAWNAEPNQPLGTGRLMGCERFSDKTLDALRAFKDEHRDRGPEVVN